MTDKKHDPTTITISVGSDGNFSVRKSGKGHLFRDYKDALQAAKDLQEKSGGPDGACIVDLAKKAGKDGA